MHTYRGIGKISIRHVLVRDRVCVSGAHPEWQPELV
jgi:hypothetical protein